MVDGSQDQLPIGDGAISPRLRKYIQRHDEKLREDLGAKMDALFAQQAERMDAKIQESITRAQHGPGVTAAIEDLREELRRLREGILSVKRDVDRLATSVDKRFELYLRHAREAARRATEPTRARDEQGRLIDPLLIAVETRRRLLGITQRGLAKILQADPSLCSRWLGRHVSPSQPTRDSMRQWLDDTDADAEIMRQQLTGGETQ